MPYLEEAIVARLAAHTGVAALIGARAYPLVVPQDVALPALAYQVISSVPYYAHDGGSGLARTRVQFTLHADTYMQIKALQKQCRLCWHAYSGTVGGVRIDEAAIDNEVDGWDDTHGAPVVLMDVKLIHAQEDT